MGTGIGCTHLNSKALEQGPVMRAGRPAVPVGSLPSQLFEDTKILSSMISKGFFVSFLRTTMSKLGIYI